MYLDANKYFKKLEDGNIKINTTRFGDFFVMASRGDYDKELYKKALEETIEKCRDALISGKTVRMIKTYEKEEVEELRYEFNDLNKFNDYIELLSKVANIELEL